MTLLIFPTYSILVVDSLTTQDHYKKADFILICQASDLVDLVGQASLASLPIFATAPNKRLGEILLKGTDLPLDEIRDLVDSIQTVSYHQMIQICPELRIYCISSGYSMGSCHWIFEWNDYKSVYFSSASLISNHVKPMELSRFKGTKLLIDACLKQKDFGSFDVFKTNLEYAINQRMHVILPIQLLGASIDLMLWVCHMLSKRNLITHCLSKIGFSMIQSMGMLYEWMTPERQKAAQSGKHPIEFQTLMANQQFMCHATLETLFAHPNPWILFCGENEFHDLIRLLDRESVLVILTDKKMLHLNVKIPKGWNIMECFMDISVPSQFIEKLTKECNITHVMNKPQDVIEMKKFISTKYLNATATMPHWPSKEIMEFSLDLSTHHLTNV